MKSVYIIEDEKPLRTLLGTFFETTFPEIEVIGMTGNGGEGIEECLKLAPDLVVVDIQLPEVGGLEILQRLKSTYPKIKILVFSGNTSPRVIKIAVDAKADGFINKITGLEELKKAILAVKNNGEFFSPEIQNEVLHIRETLT